MTNNKKKKTKTRQRTRANESAGEYSRSLRSGADPLLTLSLSAAGSSAAPDNPGVRHDNGDSLRSPAIGSNRQRPSSPLPALTSSDRDEVVNDIGPTIPTSKSASNAEHGRFRHSRAGTHTSDPTRLMSQRATIKSASDEDDHRRPDSNENGSTRRSQDRREHDSDSSSVALRLSVVPPMPSHEPHLPGSSPIPSSSPYPMGNPSADNDDSDSLRNSERLARRADSIESAELHIAATRSLQELMPSDGNSDERPNEWDDRNIKAAFAALARERSLHESSEEFQRRHTALTRNEKRLIALRTEEDRATAEALYEEQLREAADRDLAQEMEKERLDLERARREFERRREVMNNYITQQADRKRAANARGPDHPPNIRGGSRTSQRPLLAPGRDESEERRTDPPRFTHTFKDRVILQRLRCADLAAGHNSGIQDQGIDWDDSGTPYEKGVAPSRGSSVGFGGKPNSRKVDIDSRPLAERLSHQPQRTSAGHSATVPLPSASAGQRITSLAPADKEPPAKNERSPFYSRAGTTPPQRHKGSSGSGSRNGHGRGKPPPSSDSSTSDTETSTSEDSDPTYQPEDNYSRSDDTDSAWDQDPADTIEEITLYANGSQHSNIGKTRSGAQYAGQPGGNPDDSETQHLEEGIVSHSAETPRRI
ncbi:hypothetical protein DFH09DRAFT_1457233 [Mycena vulgaris]|nr:hypothetical protein DFH09DRAFT_1457233 [Mycena vulgaris]